MNDQDKQERDEQQSTIEDLTVTEEQDAEVKAGAIAVPNLLASRRSANGA